MWRSAARLCTAEPVKCCTSTPIGGACGSFVLFFSTIVVFERTYCANHMAFGRRSKSHCCHFLLSLRVCNLIFFGGCWKENVILKSLLQWQTKTADWGARVNGWRQQEKIVCARWVAATTGSEKHENQQAFFLGGGGYGWAIFQSQFYQ